jgi:hypothetical protein
MNAGWAPAVYLRYITEDTMGLFNRIRDLSTTPVPPESSLGANDVIPANTGSMSNRLRTNGGALVDKGIGFYKQNPKLVGGLALLASAVLLNRMRTPR